MTSYVSRTGVVAMSVLVVICLVAGCAAPTPEATAVPTPPPPTEEAATPTPVPIETPVPTPARAGGQMIVGWIHEPTTLNPVVGKGQPDREVPTSFVLEGLMFIDPETNSPQPWLAESVDVSADGLSYTFKLRQDVLWHDGEPFTAEDVKFTFDSILDPDVQSTVTDDFKSIEEVTVLDAYTVGIDLKEIYAPFLTMMVFPIVPKHILEGQDFATAEFNTHPVGTGPFKFEEWRAGDYISFVANEDYYRGMPELDRVVLRQIKDESALVAALLAGDIDVCSLTVDTVGTVEAAPGLKVIEGDPSWTIDLWMNNAASPFNDVKVRQAIAYAIDMEKFVKEVVEGRGYVPQSTLPPSSWAYNPDIEPKYTFDPDKARDLLTQAGWAPGADGILEKEGERFAFDITWPTGDKVREACAQYIQSRLMELGLEVEVRSMDTSSWVEALFSANYKAALVGVARPYDPDFSRMYRTGGGWNRPIGFSNPEADRIQDEALRVTDQEKRKQLYFELQDLLAAELPVFPLYNPYKYSGMKEGINLGEPVFVGQRQNTCVATSGWSLPSYKWGWTETE